MIPSNELRISALLKSKSRKVLSINKIDEQIIIEVTRIIDLFMAKNNQWSRTCTDAYQYDSLTISNVDLENVKQYTSDLNKTFSITKTKDNHIFGYFKIIEGDAMLWDSTQGVCFFNYEKDKYLTSLNCELFFDFIKMYNSKTKIILKKL